MQLTDQYKWLTNLDGPLMVVEAIKLYGTKEFAGAADNPVILSWAKEVGLQAVYTDDEIPWCGLFMAVVAKRAYKPIPKDPLWALNWKNFGVTAAHAMLGDVLVFERYSGGKLIGGHVTLYVGEDDTCYHGLGANQSDMVNITRFPKSRKPAIRRPIYKIQPPTVRQVWLSPTGSISNKED